MIKSRLCLLAGMVLALSIPGSASIIGSFSGTGTLTVTASQILWTGTNGTTAETFTLSGGSGIYNDENGVNNIYDLTNPPNIVGTTFTDQLFIHFLVAGDPDLLINFIAAGIDGQGQCGLLPAVGQVCTPFVGSPFNFQNTALGGSTASFSFAGVTADGNTWIGQFTSQFSTPFQDVLNQLGTTGSVKNAYSQTEITIFTPTRTPEPGPLSTVSLGVGLLLLSLSVKKFRRS